MNARGPLAGLVAVVLLAGVLAAVVHDDGADPGPEQARLELDGTATVTGPDGSVRELAAGTEVVDFGAQVAMQTGSGVLELPDGATFELRADDGPGTTVDVGATPRVLAGDLLVVEGFPAQVSVDTATLTAQGPLRVDADEIIASAYAGRTRVSGVGDVAELPGLRRLVLVAGAAPEPIDFDGTDEWDRRYLGEAIAFGERLEALARGYTSDLAPGRGRSVAFFQSVIPALADERELGEDLLDPSRPPGETLVGAAIAVQGRRGTFRERWEAIFAFRAAGAAWGIVALDQGVSSAPVLETIELAIGASGAAGSGAGSSSSPSTAPPTTSGGLSPTTTGTTTTTTTAPSPSPEPSEPGLLDPVLEPTSDVLAELLEALELGGG